MENKQTAVEWLQSIDLKRDLTLADWAKAKEMEKEQHLNTFLAGGKSAFNAAKGRDFTTFEDYYNETYKSE